MNSQRTTLEVIAPTINEAIEKGLVELGLPRDAVEVEILDEGSRGLFGLGSHQARIRLIVKSDEAGLATAESMHDLNELPYSEENEEEPALKPIRIPPANAKEQIPLHVAQETVSELLSKMHIQAQVDASYGEVDDVRGTRAILVDLTGKDLSVLIGKRSETLNALQYIARLIVSKELGENITLVIDVEGYRTRRERQLRQLAHRIADQAVKTGRKQTLEPMPPNERRIIHMELRDDVHVTTESFGEEPHRKVTIIPKE
ncbi:MAG TPA: RNA-binding cell elongation regulator Jag/EloR [Anaerolineales bacterium]|nr:RNA-binding cell elongation regulator Jag/EloR [Anaerolineales bacterium]